MAFPSKGGRWGVYDVTALIGEGGMGQVYHATDTKLNRQVALKNFCLEERHDHPLFAPQSAPASGQQQDGRESEDCLVRNVWTLTSPPMRRLVV